MPHVCLITQHGAIALCRHTVRGYLNSVLAAFNWADLQGWLKEAPKLRKIKTARQKVMKGRPITLAEFNRMLEATAGIVGELAAPSRKKVLRGLWEFALRLDELLHVSWDQQGAIRPIWKANQQPILDIPAAMQKDDTEECIPLFGSVDENPLSATALADNGLQQTPNSGCSPGCRNARLCESVTVIDRQQLDAQLLVIFDAWPRLSLPIRTALITMIEAAVST